MVNMKMCVFSWHWNILNQALRTNVIFYIKLSLIKVRFNGKSIRQDVSLQISTTWPKIVSKSMHGMALTNQKLLIEKLYKLWRRYISVSTFKLQNEQFIIKKICKFIWSFLPFWVNQPKFFKLLTHTYFVKSDLSLVRNWEKFNHSMQLCFCSEILRLKWVKKAAFKRK